MRPSIPSLAATAARPIRAYHRWFIRRPVRGKRRVTSTREPAWFVCAAILIALAGAGIRASFLDHPMRYDESMGFLKDVVQPLWEIPLQYDRVQNHILHTMLVHESVRWLGTGPAAIRIPAMLAGVALIPGAILLSRRLGSGRLFAMLAGAAVAVSNLLVDYSTNARGYTLVAALTLGMCLATVTIVRHPWRRRWWAVWSLSAVLGMITIPIMALPVAGLSGLILIDARFGHGGRRRRSQVRRLVANVAVVIVGSVMLYVPALIGTGPEQFLGVRHVVMSYSRGVIGSTTDLAGACWHDWTLDVGWMGLTLLIGGLTLSLAAAVRRRSALNAMPLVMWAGGAAIALLLPVTSYARVWLYLLPVVLAVGVGGLALLPGRYTRGIAALMLAAAIVLNGYRVTKREFLIAEDANTLLDAESIARSLNDFEDRRFALITVPSTYAVRYYYTTGVRAPHPAHPSAPQVEGALVVVNQTQTLDEVVDARRVALDDYGPPVLHRTLPHSRLYWMPRKNHGRSLAVRD